MTKQTLAKLDSKHKLFLDDRKAVLKRTNKKDDVIGEIRGYLAALRRCKVISDAEFRVLYTFYTLDRGNNN